MLLLDNPSTKSAMAKKGSSNLERRFDRRSFINITSVSPDDMPKWDKPALIDATSANDEGYE